MKHFTNIFRCVVYDICQAVFCLYNSSITFCFNKFCFTVGNLIFRCGLKSGRSQHLKRRRLFSTNQAGNHEQYYFKLLPPTRYFTASTFNNEDRRRSKNKELAHKRVKIRSVTSKIPNVGATEWLLKSRNEKHKEKRLFADNHREKRGQSTNGIITSEKYKMLK